MAKVYFISGFQVHQAKKVCQFVFGDYFVDIKMNQKEMRFEIKVKKSIMINNKDVLVGDYIDLQDFKNFWVLNGC